MEAEGSLPHSQEPATCPYPELSRTKESVQVRGSVQCFVTW
jgi:hypothetical protein